MKWCYITRRHFGGILNINKDRVKCTILKILIPRLLVNSVLWLAYDSLQACVCLRQQMYLQDGGVYYCRQNDITVNPCILHVRFTYFFTVQQSVWTVQRWKCAKLVNPLWGKAYTAFIFIFYELCCMAPLLMRLFLCMFNFANYKISRAHRFSLLIHWLKCTMQNLPVKNSNVKSYLDLQAATIVKLTV